MPLSTPSSICSQPGRAYHTAITTHETLKEKNENSSLGNTIWPKGLHLTILEDELALEQD